MHVINARKIVTRSAQDLIKEFTESLSSIEGPPTDVILNSPSLVMIRKLDEIEDDKARKSCQILNRIIKSHPESLFLLSEMHVDRLKTHHGLKLYENLSLGSVVNSEVSGNSFNNLFPPHWIIIKDPVNFVDYGALRDFTWVIISSSPEGRTQTELAGIAKIIAHCNAGSRCVSTIPYISLDKLESAIQNVEPEFGDSLHYELPITDKHTLILAFNEVRSSVDNAQNMIQKWTNIGTLSTMIVAYELYQLQKLARQVGQKSFWKTYFNVDSSEGFATKFLGVSRSTAYRYLQAIEVSEKLHPGGMASIVSGKKERPKKALGYSRYLEVHPYLDDIEKASDEDKQVVQELLLDPSVAAKTLKTHLAEHFTSSNLPTKQPPFDIDQYLNAVGSKLESNLDEHRQYYLNQYLLAVRHLFDPDAEHFTALGNAIDVAVELVQSKNQQEFDFTSLGQA
jgi:hypothetical protein